MIRLLRIVGYLLFAVGVLVLLVWAIEPLRFVWPLLLQLPWPVQLGLGVAAAGLILLLGSLIWERLEERDSDRDLRREP